MSKKTGLASSAILLAAVIVLTLSMSANMAWAQSGFSIPTSTPVGSSGDSSGLSSGLFIATSTPVGSNAGGAANSGGSLSQLDAASLQALNIQAEDVPADFAATQNVLTYDIETMAAQIEPNSKDMAAMLRQISDQYGWKNSVGIEYTACDPSIPVSRIYSEVAPLSSPELARAFADDPRLTQFYTQFGVTVTPATSVHGFYTITPAQAGACSTNEVGTYLNFEYQGLFISVAITANNTTDPAMVNSMLDQLAGIVVGRVDAAVGGSFQPTLSGAAQNNGAAQATATKVPFTLGGSNAAQNNNNTQAGKATLDTINAALPTIDEVGLPTDTFALNTQLSTTQTTDQLVAYWQNLGLTDIASALDTTLQASGSLGQVVRVWDTRNNCTQTVGISLEVDVMLFQTTDGPAAYLSDQTFLNTLASHGMQIQTLQGGGLYTMLPYTDTCGNMITYTRVYPYGRFVISASVIAYQAAPEKTVTDALDTLAQFTAQKLDQAGLQ